MCVCSLFDLFHLSCVHFSSRFCFVFRSNYTKKPMSFSNQLSHIMPIIIYHCVRWIRTMVKVDFSQLGRQQITHSFTMQSRAHQSASMEQVVALRFIYSGPHVPGIWRGIARNKVHQIQARRFYRKANARSFVFVESSRRFLEAAGLSLSHGRIGEQCEICERNNRLPNRMAQIF